MQHHSLFVRILSSPFILALLATFVFYSAFLPIWIYRYVLLEWGWFWFIVSWLILSGVFGGLVTFSATIGALGGRYFFYDKIYFLSSFVITSFVGYLTFDEIWVSTKSQEIGTLAKILISIPVFYGIGFLMIISLRWLIFGVDEIHE